MNKTKTTNSKTQSKNSYRKYGKISNMISQRQYNTNRDSQLITLDINNQYTQIFTENTQDKFFIFLASSENYVSKTLKAMIQSNTAYYYAYFDISPQISQKFKLPANNLLGSGNGYYEQLKDKITNKAIPGAYLCQQSTLTDEIKQLIQQQSNGMLVNMASNNLVYSKTLQLYKPKAYDYMNDVIQNYVEGTQSINTSDNETIVKYYQNDKMLVIMPTTNFSTSNNVVNNQQWNIQLKRTYYIRKQDISIGNAKEPNINQKEELPDQNAINTQGNENAQDNEIAKGYLLKTAAEVGNIIANNNGIVIDSNCYDENEGALSATAIIDLQPAPQDTELINHENETAASNAFVEVAGQQISSVQDVNKVNIGPNWQEIPDSGVAQCICPTDIVRSYTYTQTGSMGNLLNEPTYDIASLYINCQVGTTFTYGDSTTALVQITLTQNGNDYTMAVSTLAGTLTFFQKEQIISYLNHQNISVYPYLPIAYYFPLVITQIETAYVVAVEASKVWKKIKTGLHKAAKWIGGRIKGIFKIAPKILKGVSSLLPGPVGTVANIVGEGIDSITSVINAKSVATSANNVLSVSDYSTEEDVFVCTPQYRITDQPTADITQGNDWQDGESFNVPVLEAGSLTSKMYKCTHQVKEHPLIKQIVSGRLTAASGVAVQQRLKIKFLKHCTRQIANAYKAGLIIGSDTYCQ